MSLLDLLGRHASHPGIESYLNNLGCSISNPTDSDVHVYPDTVYINHKRHGISLAFQPEDGYSASAQNLQMDRLILTGIDTYNAGVKKYSEFVGLPLVIQVAPPTVCRASTGSHSSSRNTL